MFAQFGPLFGGHILHRVLQAFKLLIQPFAAAIGPAIPGTVHEPADS